MVTIREELMGLAARIASSAEEEYDGHWCLFAGFAFVLNGVEKKTYDIDLLTKDVGAYRYLTGLLQKLGLRLMTATEGYSSFRAAVTDREHSQQLTLDLLSIDSEWLKPLKNMWSKLEKIRVGEIPIPVAHPIHLILLKMLVNSRRQSGDRKKEQDLVDVKRIMAIRSITTPQVMKEASIQDMEDTATKFLERLDGLSCSGSNEEAAGRITLRRMTEADTDTAIELAMLANPLAAKERYGKFIISQMSEFPELTFVAATDGGRRVVGYVTSDTSGDEACIEDIAVAPPWQRKGVGKMLLTESIRLLRERKTRLVKVEVHYKCSSAIPFYYAFGFRFASCTRDRFGKGEDAMTLTRELS
ncbi:MAG: GNAT family N-acetyltransferase [Promethearchaeati archaeon SRVP18_Atabeyarchaeia-1]